MIILASDIGRILGRSLMGTLPSRHLPQSANSSHGSIKGFGSSFVLSAVYYSGTELVAITAGESNRPQKDVPKVRPHAYVVRVSI